MPNLTFETALRALADRERQELEQHPAPDTLLAYHLRRLESADRDRVQDHLSVCSECASFILNLGPVADPGPDALSIDKGQVEAEWRRLQERLGGGQEAPAESRGVPFYGRLRFAYSLAAALLVAVVGLAVWFPRGELDSVALNPPYVELSRMDSGTRGGEGAADLAASPSRQAVFFVLQLPTDAQEYPNYRLQIRRGDEPVKDVDGLIANVHRELTFILTRSFSKGSYRIDLYGSAARGEQGTFLYEYSYQVE